MPSFNTTFNPYSAQQGKIDRQRKIAELLQRQSMQSPEGQMVSGHYVAPSITQHLARLLQGYSGNRADQDANAQQDQMATQIQTEAEDWQRSMPQARTVEGQMPPGQEGPGAPVQQQPTPEEQMAWALRGLNNPLTQGAASTMATQIPQIEDRRLARQEGADLRREMLTSQQAAAQQAQAERLAAQQQAADQQRQFQAMSAQQQRDFMAQQNSLNRQNQRDLLTIKESQNVPKLPTSALKLQQEELEAIGTASTINADIGSLQKQIESGKLDLGPVENLKSRAKNAIGISDENSRNFASFQATLEKMRNDSLRLNKGVQTEGDAVRAWNELVESANDPKVVAKRLGEIQKINERAANLRRMQVDSIRSNFGVEPMNTTGYSNQPPAIGATQSGWSIKPIP